MKKESIFSIVVYLTMIIASIVLGFTIIRDQFALFFKELSGPQLTGIGIVFLLLGILINAVLIECGHILGAIAGHYSVYSVNVLHLNLFKEEKKWKFRIRPFDGLTGETKIVPKQTNKKRYLNLFCILPLIFYVLVVAVFVFLLNELKKGTNTNLSHWTGAFMFFVIVGGLIQFYNIFPAKLDCLNDGYILTLINKPISFEAYNEFLRIKYANSNNVEITDYKIFDQIEDFSAEINLYAIYDLLKKKNYSKAEEIIDLNLANIKTISKSTYYFSLCHKIYLLYFSKGLDECKKFCDFNLDINFRKFLNNTQSAESLRAYLIISGLIENSEFETRNAINLREKVMKKFPLLWKNIEESLFDICVTEIKQKHKDWDIDNKEVI